MSNRSTQAEQATGPGSVTGVDHLPPGFTDTFTSRWIDTDSLRTHAVVGGDGPPLLVLGGWPQTWYAWRLILPALAEHFTVVAIDPRGTGRTSRPASDEHGSGYDSGTLATDCVEIMAALGHERFALLAHDIGTWTGYALAADWPDRVERMVASDAIVPGLLPSPPLLDDRRTSDQLWHFNFNRTTSISEQLVAGRERVYFGHQFATKAATPASIPQHAVDVYVGPLEASRDALHASFHFYRAIDAILEQNEQRKQRTLDLPVLVVSGSEGCGQRAVDEMRAVARDVTGVVIPGCGHYVPEEAPDELLRAALPFLRAR